MPENVILALSMTVATAAYITFLSYFLLRRIRERGGTFRKAKELFFEELSRRITLDVILDLDDVGMVKNWANSQQESSRFEETPIDELLEEFLSIVTQGAEREEHAKERYVFVESLIDKKRAEEPFSILPSDERTKARRLQQYIESGQTGEAVSLLQELANSVGGLLRGLDKAATRNRNLAIVAAIASISAIPLAIIF